MRLIISLVLLSAVAFDAQTGEVQLPKTLAWSAYNLGTTGYNQAVAIGKVLKDEYNVTLRVIPGKNDISRLLPLMKGRVQLSANGMATYFAQEGVFQFENEKWGPIRVRLVISSNGESNQSLAVAADTGITHPSELKGLQLALHGGGMSRKSYLYAEDLSRAARLAAEHGPSGAVYNVGPKDTTSIRALVERVCEKVGVPLEQVAQLSPARMGEESPCVLDSSLIASQLGWSQQIDLDQGLDRTIDWVKQHLDFLKKQPTEFVLQP